MILYMHLNSFSYYDKFEELKKSIPNLSEIFKLYLEKVMNNYHIINPKETELEDLKNKIENELSKLDKITEINEKLYNL